jgi:ribosomal protein L32
MPLLKGTSKKTISKNISELENSKTKRGKARSHKQNIAIALAEARKSGAKIPKPNHNEKIMRMHERSKTG